MTKTLARPDYIELNRHGRIEAVFCKLCGDQIAGFRGDGYQRRFFTFPSYVQFLIDCDDGSQHLTNLCTRCLEEAVRDVGVLQLLHDADVEILEKESKGMKKFYKDRKATKFGKVDPLGEGKK